MQNKGAIWLFTILLVVACLYEMSFSFFTGGVEAEAKVVATQKLDSLNAESGEEMDLGTQDSLFQSFEADYLVTQANVEVVPFIGTTYKRAKEKEINLGLDLQGGMHVTMEVSVPALVRALGSNSANPTFQKALRMAEEKMVSSQDDYVTLFGQSIIEIDPDFKLAAVFHNMNNKEKFPRDADNAAIIQIIRLEAEDAVKRTEQVLRKRIDNLGVVQPKIQRLTTSDRIVVELPGIKDPKRVRKILQGTAKLEFWETYDNNDIYELLGEINQILKVKDSIANLSKKDTSALAVLDDFEQLPAEEEDTEEVLAEEVVENDSNATGNLFSDLANPSDSTSDSTSNLAASNVSNPLFEVLVPALNSDENGQLFKVQGPVVGYATVNNMKQVDAFLAGSEAKAIIQRTVGRGKIKFLWSSQAFDDNNQFYQLYAIKVGGRNAEAPMEGDAVTNARVDTDPLGNPEVTLLMNSTGAKEWADLTAKNVGQNVAIVLDDFVYSAPTVQTEIKGGRSSISGRFSPEEAEDLANVLKAGKLPAPANIIEEAIVGPSLGQEAISSGLRSFILALIIILAYMIFYYNRAGIVADIALLANVFFVFGVLTALGATLTLPGIAGIVLTIGMSVDANVLIYERIREELAAGKGLKTAISDGYANARSSILDANITTLLTGIILGVFGTGPIKGFATTLIIGILTSLFSAIFITRLIFEWQMSRNQKINFSTKLTQGAFKNLNIAFIPRRRIFYVISSLVVLAGIASYATRGLNYGVDFTGGRSYVVRFDEAADVEKIGVSLGAAFVSAEGNQQRPEVKVFGTSNQVKITTKYLIEQKGQEVDVMVEDKLNEGLAGISSSFEIMSSQKVEPTIADDIKQSAVWAVIFSLVIIFLYILLRFRRWQYGVGALIAMFHDVLVVLAVFSIFYGILPFSLEIDQAFIAAILTVVGYSINDTVVVFDRIREHLGLYKHRQYDQVVNGALNSTLSRTVNTSLSTFFVLLLIFLFGGEVIQGFIFALMIGVAVGTYSSLCVATPILLDFGAKQLEAEVEAAEEKK
jgi:SecD/SecF fusion protein